MKINKSNDSHKDLSGYRCIPIILIVLSSFSLLVSFLSTNLLLIRYISLGLFILEILLVCIYSFSERAFENEVRNIFTGEHTELLGTKDSIVKDAFSKEIKQYICNLSPSKAEKEYKNEISTKKIELATLQGQINPHFLYNTLDSIRGEALICGADEIANMTEALAMIFRYCISIRGDLVTISDELSNIKNYLLIQKFRFEDRFSFKTIIEASDSALDYCLPKLTLQPIVENALFHGLETRKSGGELILRITETDRCMVIRVEDNGCGMSQEKLSALNLAISSSGNSFAKVPSRQGGGIALLNVNDRLKLLFGDEYGIVIYSQEGIGTTVEMTVPKSSISEHSTDNT
jgi:two-component system sensor histidine kinase YesM